MTDKEANDIADAMYEPDPMWDLELKRYHARLNKQRKSQIYAEVRKSIAYAVIAYAVGFLTGLLIPLF